MNIKESHDSYCYWLAACVVGLLVLLIWASGCNTVHGIGTDLVKLSESSVEADK